MIKAHPGKKVEVSLLRLCEEDKREGLTSQSQHRIMLVWPIRLIGTKGMTCSYRQTLAVAGQKKKMNGHSSGRRNHKRSSIARGRILDNHNTTPLDGNGAWLRLLDVHRLRRRGTRSHVMSW